MKLLRASPIFLVASGARAPRAGLVFATRAFMASLALLACAAPPAVAASASKSDTLIERDRLIKGRMPIRGVVRPAAKASISTDLVAKVTRVGFREGERFRSGDTLFEFDCQRQRAELASLDAQRREMLVAHQSAMMLVRRNVGTRHDAQITGARLERATANHEALEIRLRQCRITAPYDGIVAELSIREHETANSGRPLVTIAATRDPEIELIVPASELAWLKPGALFEFNLKDIEATQKGTVTRIGAAVDTVSQTFKVYGRFSEPVSNIVPGLSGTARFPEREQ